MSRKSRKRLRQARRKGRQSRRPIERAWDTYRRAAVPEGADDTQVNETRQAFFAGASSVFWAMLMASDEPGEGPGMALLTNLQAEIDEYGEALDARYLGTDPRKH